MKEGIIRLNKPIGAGGITAVQFSQDFDNLVKSGVDKIVVLINTIGGNVIEGMEIYSTIADAPIDTETRVVGISASMGGIISQAGKKRTIKEHALFHAHSPRPAEGKTASQSVLKLAYDSIKGFLIGRSGMEENTAVEMLSKETFLSAKQSFELGLFDEVLKSSISEKTAIKNTTDSTEILNIINNLEDKKKDMSKLNAILGLTAEASETAQLEALTGLKSKASETDSLKATLTEKENVIATLKAQIESEQKSKANILVENAIKEGKISEEMKEIWVNNAVQNFDSTSKMLESLKATAQSQNIMNTTNQNGGNSQNRKDWDFEKWSKEDPKGLEKLQLTNKVEFDRLLNDYTK